ncbi:MAG: 7-cyano-7-deazaguanine synthase, partial [Syntrophales bacterium]|nr:7-cyano-7-deazaguanine synthase [Syntrophales bacterium]
MRKKVAIALSGGVDSSTAAWLLKEEGYDVVGVTMHLSIPTEAGGRKKCCSPQEIEDPRRVCEMLDIPHHVLDFADDLDLMVIRPFVAEYLRGRTPNPCVECNRAIKFGSLLKKVRAMGFDYLATGHYARVEHTPEISYLRVARDAKKDQTYFLYAMAREALQ